MYEKSHKYWLAYSFHCFLLNMLDIFLSFNWGINQEMINQYNSSTHSNSYYHSNYKEIFIHSYTRPNKNMPAYLPTVLAKIAQNLRVYCVYPIYIVADIWNQVPY